MRVLITGGAGFIGSHFIRYILRERPEVTVTNLDALTYAGNLANLRDVEDDPRYRFVHGRVEERKRVEELIGEADTVVHFAAETHVDRSVEDSTPFLMTNVLGTQILLEAASRRRLSLFLYVSTDEVYGSLGHEGCFTEESPLQPRSLYAASKAAADHLVSAYHVTHGLPAVIARPSNNYGPYQYPEKFIALLITNALTGRPLPVYGRGENVREWIHVEDTCRALDLLLSRGKAGEVYNVGSGQEQPNREVARLILMLTEMPDSLLTCVPDRPGHDFRYALDSSKVKREVGWEPRVSFEEGLRRTVAWYGENRAWWQGVKERLERESRGYWS